MAQNCSAPVAESASTRSLRPSTKKSSAPATCQLAPGGSGLIQSEDEAAVPFMTQSMLRLLARWRHSRSGRPSLLKSPLGREHCAPGRS